MALRHRAAPLLVAVCLAVCTWSLLRALHRGAEAFVQTSPYGGSVQRQTALPRDVSMMTTRPKWKEHLWGMPRINPVQPYDKPNHKWQEPLVISPAERRTRAKKACEEEYDQTIQQSMKIVKQQIIDRLRGQPRTLRDFVNHVLVPFKRENLPDPKIHLMRNKVQRDVRRWLKAWALDIEPSLWPWKVGKDDIFEAGFAFFVESQMQDQVVIRGLRNNKGSESVVWLKEDWDLWKGTVQVRDKEKRNFDRDHYISLNPAKIVSPPAPDLPPDGAALYKTDGSYNPKDGMMFWGSAFWGTGKKEKVEAACSDSMPLPMRWELDESVNPQRQRRQGGTGRLRNKGENMGRDKEEVAELEAVKQVLARIQKGDTKVSHIWTQSEDLVGYLAQGGALCTRDTIDHARGYVDKYYDEKVQDQVDSYLGSDEGTVAPGDVWLQWVHPAIDIYQEVRSMIFDIRKSGKLVKIKWAGRHDLKDSDLVGRTAAERGAGETVGAW